MNTINSIVMDRHRSISPDHRSHESDSNPIDYIIRTNTRLEEENRKLQQSLIEKTAELEDITEQADNYDDRLKTMRGLLHNYNAIQKQQATLLVKITGTIGSLDYYSMVFMSMFIITIVAMAYDVHQDYLIYTCTGGCFSMLLFAMVYIFQPLYLARQDITTLDTEIGRIKKSDFLHEDAIDLL